MQGKMERFIENYSGAFFIGSLVTQKVIYVNKKARTLFGVTVDNCCFQEILGVSDDRITMLMDTILKVGKNSMIYNFLVAKADGEGIVVDIQVGYFDDECTEVFMEIIPQNDTRMQMAIHQVDNSHLAEAILNLDDGLSIIHCNKHFHEIFDFNEELRHSHYKNNLVNAFFPSSNENILAEIRSVLAVKKSFSTRVKIVSAFGVERHCLFEIERRSLDSSGEHKAIAFITNIDEQVAMEEKAVIFADFSKAIQNFTSGIMFRIDIESMTLFHLSVTDKINNIFGEKGVKISDYVDVFVEKKIVYLDDALTFKESFLAFFDGKNVECTLRFSLFGEAYELYDIKVYNTYDRNGKLTQVIGAFVNIESRVKILEENYRFNQYFNVFQDLFQDFLYIVEMPSKTLRHYTPNAFSGKFGNVIPDHVEELIQAEIIHPEDVANYREQIAEFISDEGQVNFTPIRVAVFDMEYKWYTFSGKKIYDERGNIKEIFGALINIENEVLIQAKVDKINNYFETLQYVSDESFYIYDVKTRKIVVTGKVREELNIIEPIVNSQDDVLNKIHPDNVVNFIQYYKKSIKGIASKVEVQILTSKDDYHWYELNSKAIYNDDGDIFEVVGNVKNIHSVKNMSVQNSSLSKYISALQEFSKDVLFRVDVPTMTLHHSHLSERMKKVGTVIPNYVETIIENKIVHPDDANIYRRAALQWFQDENLEYEVRFSIDDEYTYEWFCVKAKKIYDDDGNFVEALGTMINTQKEHNIHREYDQIHQYFKAMQDLSDDIIFHIDIATKTFNHSHENQYGLQFSNSIPNFVENFILSGYIHPEHIKTYREYTDKLFMGLNQEYKVQALVSEGVYNWFNIKCKYVYNDMNHPVEIFGKMCNIQEKLDLQRKARYDNLTNALSREAFEEHITNDLSQSNNISNALIFIDLDNFKYINDNFGHKYGDFVLQKFTERVSNCIKSTDIIGRVGGDEFLVYLRDVGSPEIALSRASQIIENMIRPISDGQFAHKLGLSIGVAVSPHHGSDLLTLYENADKAVYVSKDRGKNTATLYNQN